MASAHEFTIESDLAGVRLDLALTKLLPDQSRSFLARLIEQKHVGLNGSVTTKPAFRLTEGDYVRVEIPSPAPIEVQSQALPLTVVYSDADVAVIDKPAGLVVHPGAGHADSTLVNALLFHMTDLSGIGGVLRPGIVHRLDKDTSGLLVIAKNDQAHRQLSAVWSTGAVVKQYTALVYGTPKVQEGTIDLPIGRDPRNRQRMTVAAGGRSARTRYRVSRQLTHSCLVECTLLTGRTHQIRVHLKALGHPIIGDPLYSGPQWKGIPDKHVQRVLAGFRRQALHATKLSFPHPVTGQPLSFESALPEDIQTLIDALTLR